MGPFIGALNLLLSNLEPALEEQAQADVIHNCLHSVMALPPEPKGEDGIDLEVLPVQGGRGAGQGVRSAFERKGIIHGAGGLAFLTASVSGYGVCPSRSVNKPAAAEHDPPRPAGHGRGVLWVYTAGVMGFEYPTLCPAPTVVRYYGDSLVVSLGEGCLNSAWAPLTRQYLCSISLTMTSAGMEHMSPGCCLLTT